MTLEQDITTVLEYSRKELTVLEIVDRLIRSADLTNPIRNLDPRTAKHWPLYMKQALARDYAPRFVVNALYRMENVRMQRKELTVMSSETEKQRHLLVLAWGLA